ncbi:hypothetical protein [Promineifilum sp.]
MDVATQIMLIFMAIVAEKVLEEFARGFWDSWAQRGDKKYWDWPER